MAAERYRGKLSCICDLKELEVPLVLMSATMPPTCLPLCQEWYGLIQTEFRTGTQRRNLRFHVQPVKIPARVGRARRPNVVYAIDNEARAPILDYVFKKWVKLDHPDRVLIFVWTVADAGEVSLAVENFCVTASDMPVGARCMFGQMSNDAP